MTVLFIDMVMTDCVAMTLRSETDQTPDTLPALPTPSSRHGCISLAIRPPEALLCFCTVQPVLFVTALNVSKN